MSKFENMDNFKIKEIKNFADVTLYGNFNSYLFDLGVVSLERQID